VAGPFVPQPPNEPPAAAPDRHPSADRSDPEAAPPPVSGQGHQAAETVAGMPGQDSPGPKAPTAPGDGDARAGRSVGPPASVGDRQPPTPPAPSGSTGVPGREAENGPPQAATDL